MSATDYSDDYRVLLVEWRQLYENWGSYRLAHIKGLAAQTAAG
ncbi:hypothetical protein M2271_008283 [Streptomyces sp. LBL]|nr:hypothetical protein [Streptomyces sp. LBL]MDH6630423.1 hypothetical protein [Streptomyces sp. LBL]